MRELDLEFAKVEVGAAPARWSVVQGDATGLSVVAAGHVNVLRGQSSRESLIGLYTAPWPANQLAAEFRLPSDGRSGPAFVLGYGDPANHYRVFLDPAAGAIRVSRLLDGKEMVAAEKRPRSRLGSGSRSRSRPTDAPRQHRLCYGYVYDAGSDGGAGMNRFGELVLNR